MRSKNGQFQPGHIPEYTAYCNKCGKTFIAKNIRRKRCHDCCKCEQCGIQLQSTDHRFCGNSCAGKWKFANSPKAKQALIDGRTLAYTPEAREKTVAARRGKPSSQRGEKHYKWKGGGIRDARRIAMSRIEYKIWRETVFKRDGYTCIICKEPKTGRMEAHHIHTWTEAPDRRYDPENGVTLCFACHRLVSGKEHVFRDRFIAHVATADPVVLTDEEIAQFQPLIVPCDYCGKELTRHPSQRSRKLHFCNRACYRTYQRKEKL